MRGLALLVGTMGLMTCGGAEPTLNNGWLTISSESGAWLKPGGAGAVEVSINDKPWPSADVPAVAVETGDGTLEVRYETAEGRLSDRFVPLPALGPSAWLRTVRYTNLSGKPQDVTGAALWVMPVAAPDKPKWNPHTFWMAESTAGQSVCLSYRGTTDFYRLDQRPDGRVGHHVDACWRLAPGQEATIGDQGIWVSQAGADGFRQDARRWYEAIGLQVPGDTPSWAMDAILYETNAGGHIDSRFSDVGGFDRLARQADYLADLGVTAVWLQAVHRHKSPPDPARGGWNLYDPLDCLAIDEVLGGAPGLKRLSEAFRGSGLRMIGELVPHGGHSTQALALEPWWTYTREGKAQRNWGGCGMDYSSPEWQQVMRDQSALLAKGFGFEGARIDVADGSGANWKSPKTNHASYSTLAGSIEMLRAIRDGLKEGGASPLLLPENFNTVEHFAVSPVGYGHNGWMLIARELPGMKNDPAAMVAKLREFYETERGAYPPGARLLRTLNNHDTVCENGRVDYRYGAGLARALYGVCLMVEGIPMMYQEEEVGSFDALRKLNWARRSIPEFATGEPDYTSIDFAPEVFACLRSTATGCAVGLSNLSGATVQGMVKLPASVRLSETPTVYDAVSQRQATVADRSFSWSLDPYETALIRVGRAPEAAMPPAAFPGEPAAQKTGSSPLTVTVAPAGLDIRAGGLVAQLKAGKGPWEAVDGTHWRSPEGRLQVTRDGDDTLLEVHLAAEAPAPDLFILNGARWHVSARTALLSDTVLRRHYPFPADSGYAWNREIGWSGANIYNGVVPAGRLWQSLLEPLHPDRAAVGIEDHDGQGLLLSEITTNAENVVLTDRTDEQTHEPYGLALRFWGTDPDLNPRVHAVGMGQPWAMEGEAPRRKGEQVLRLRLHAVMDGDWSALDALRLPVDRGEARQALQGTISRDQGAYWFQKPGTVGWSDLRAPAGRHRLRLELRHSEAGPTGTDLDDAYTLRVNNRPVPFTWEKRDTFHTGNAYFGTVVTEPMEMSEVETLEIRGERPWTAFRGTVALVRE